MLGLDEADATRLASALPDSSPAAIDVSDQQQHEAGQPAASQPWAVDSCKRGRQDPLQPLPVQQHPRCPCFVRRRAAACCCCVASQARLAEFVALRTPLKQLDWCICFSRCAELLQLQPSVLGERVASLQAAMRIDDAQLVASVLRSPSLLQHDPQDIATKVRAALQRALHAAGAGSAMRMQACHHALHVLCCPCARVPRCCAARWLRWLLRWLRCSRSWSCRSRRRARSSSLSGALHAGWSRG